MLTSTVSAGRLSNSARKGNCSAGLVLGPMLLIFPVISWAGVSVTAVPTFPALLQVGQVDVPASITVANASTPPEDIGSITLSNIKLMPSCGSGVSSVCQPADQDGGVFQVVGPAVGTSGSASCTAQTFTIGAPDPVTGEVEFTPNQVPVTLDTPGVQGDHCTISFVVDVLRLPDLDASENPGVQTAQLASVVGISSTNGLVAMASGAGLTTVIPGVCVGACVTPGNVTVADIVTLVSIALGNAGPSACSQGIPDDVDVDVQLILQAVNNIFDGCAA